MPFDTCVCCKNRFGLDDKDLVMIHEGVMGQGKRNGGRPVETRAELDYEKALSLVLALMGKFNIRLDDLRKDRGASADPGSSEGGGGGDLQSDAWRVRSR